MGKRLAKSAPTDWVNQLWKTTYDRAGFDR
jgi:hypothetical protein